MKSIKTNVELPQQTIDQALQQAIAHHREGQLQEAELLYRAILQTQPNHPDANHNLGVLAVRVKQPAAGLPHLKAALEANQNQGQYWLSYIDALIQTGQTDVARQVLEQGRQGGLKGEAVDALAVRLESDAQAAEQSNAEYQLSFKAAPPVSSAVPQDGKKSKNKPTKPNKLARKSDPYKKNNPRPKEIINLATLFSEGRYTEAATLAQAMTERFPLHGFGWKVLGAVFKQMGRNADALAPMQKAVALSPRDADAHSNLGVTLRNMGRLNEAEASYRQALEIKPDYAEAHNNMGITLQEQGRLDEAEASYRQALQIKPDFAEVLNNLGGVLRYLGRLDEAEACYRRALQIKPDFASAQCYFGHTLCELDNLSQAAVAYQKALDFEPGGFGLDAAVSLAILHYLEGDIEQCANKLLKAQSIMTTNTLAQKNSRTYWSLLNKLVSWHRHANQEGNQTQGMDTIYVIGESHTLSTHGVVVRYNGQQMRCTAEWIAGCKQWHLGNGKANKYKHKFEAVMARLPRGSKILLCIGEIDCRHDEGILKAWKKYTGKAVDEIIRSTVDAYLDYVQKIAGQYGHRIIIGGVPCTNIALDALAVTAADQLVYLIRIFNEVLKSRTLAAVVDFLDVYALTDRGNGIAHGEWYIDHYHLLPSAVVAAFDRYCIQGAASNIVRYPTKQHALIKSNPVKPDKSARISSLHQGKMPSLQEMNTLVALYTEGRLVEVARHAQTMTERFPQHGFGWKALGTVFKQMGRSADAVAPMQRAVALSPDDAEVHCNLGITLKDMGRLDEAEAACRRALEINPDYAEAHNGLGVILYDLGRLDDAEASYRWALQIKPDFADAHNNLGNTLRDMARMDEAEGSYLRVLEIASDSVSNIFQLASYNYAASLYARGLHRKSVFYYQQAFSGRVGWHHTEDGDLSSGLARAFVELTNKCNFHCDFCPSDSQHRTQGFMSLELIRQLYDEFSEKNLVKEVELHLMGEPTLHPDLMEVLDYAASKNIKTELVTNGSTLNAKSVPRILDTLYGDLAVSLQTPSRDTFKHRGDTRLSWDRYIGNIRLLVREHLKRVALKHPCRYTLDLRVMITKDSKLSARIIESSDDIRRVMREWYDFVADLETEFGLLPFRRKELPSGIFSASDMQTNINYSLQQGLTLRFWQGFSFANSMLSSEYSLEYKETATFCHHPFLDVAILSNGDVTLCCLDYDGKLAVGNMEDNTIESILNGKPTMNLRAAMLGRHPLPPFCQQCQAKATLPPP